MNQGNRLEVHVRPVCYPEVVSVLRAEFATVPVEVVEWCVASEARHFEDGRITAYLSILVEKAARQRVRELSSS